MKPFCLSQALRGWTKLLIEDVVPIHVTYHHITYHACPNRIRSSLNTSARFADSERDL